MKALNSNYPAGWTNLHLLARENNYHQLESAVDRALQNLSSWDVILFSSRLSQTPLHVAATNAHPTSVRVLLNKGHPVNAEDVYGNTPLHVAIEHGRIATALMLIDAGANVNALNDIKWTPLHLAVRGNHVGLIRYLRKRGANQNIVEENDFMDVPSIWDLAMKDATYNALESH